MCNRRQILGLMHVCLLCAALAEATGVLEPAPVGSSAEAIQVAALAALVGLAAGPEAGLLGSGTPAVLRVLSNLHSLQVRLRLSHARKHRSLVWRP